MTTRPDPSNPETPQKAVDGPQGSLEGASGGAETLEGQNGPQTGAQRFQTEQQPRGPVDWARQQAAERATTAPAAALHPLVKGRCPACRGASLFLGSDGYVTCSRLDCPNPGAADKLLHGEQAATARNVGPSVRECAANDRRWWDSEKAGE